MDGQGLSPEKGFRRKAAERRSAGHQESQWQSPHWILAKQLSIHAEKRSQESQEEIPRYEDRKEGWKAF